MTLYETLPRAARRRDARAVLGADWITFTAGSAVRSSSRRRRRGRLRGGPRLASIGPVTSAALREAGLEPDLEAAEHTPDGLVAALVG